jgi:hypothetical protein
VRAAIPGVQHSGRSLALARLHVSFGAPLEATDTATSYQLQRMVHRFRQAKEDPPAFLTESEAEVRKKIQDVKILGAEEADLEVKMQKVQAKKRKWHYRQDLIAGPMALYSIASCSISRLVNNREHSFQKGNIFTSI